jgi:carboxyl-terminal processing protease
MRRNLRFIIAGVALMTAFILTVTFSDRGFQFDVNKGGSPVLAGSLDGYNLAGGEVLKKVLLQVNEKYVDRTRIDPNRMLVHGLDEIQKSVPEIVVTFDKEIDADPSSMVVQVDDKTKNFKIGGFQSLWEMSFKIQDVFRFMQENLTESEKVKFRDIEYAAINGMLNTLDPHSVLLSPEVYKEMQTQTGGKFGGLGIVIGIRDGGLTVISPMDGTPASRAGIKSKDKIIRINDESTINMSLNDAVSKLRGEPDSKVSIWVARKGWASPREIELTRAEIKIKSVESHMLSNKIGYVKLKSFQANSYDDLREQLDALSGKAGGLNGLVLDLRNNPGGLLDQAIKISDTFLSKGTIVSTVGFGNKLRDETKANKRNTEPEYPIVVLVDSGSASASEIVAGALKNHNRAVIVGDTTFGKGSVQVIYGHQDSSALKLTIAQYLTPGDISIQSVGITPDIKLIPAIADKKGVDMFLPSHITREADLDAHLDHANVRQGDKPVAFLRYSEPREPEFDPDKVETDKFKEDFSISFAKQVIRATGRTFERAAMLKKIAPTMTKVAKSEMDDISKELTKLGVDWSAGSTPSASTIDVKFETDKEKDAVIAGDSIKITATVTNTGKSTIHRFRGIVEADDGNLNEREFIFGRVDPGMSRSWSIDVDVPKFHSTREEHLKVNFGAANTELDVNKTFVLRTISRPSPHFAFNYFLDDSKKGNGDGILQPGETVSMKLMVSNTGKGAAEKTSAMLRNLNDAALFLKKGQDETKGIAAGTTHTFNFEFEVKEVTPKPMKVEIDIYDEVLKVLTRDEITLQSETSSAFKVKKTKGSFSVKGSTPVLSAARPNAHIIGRIEATNAAVVAKAGEMYQVELVGGARGWIKGDAGTFKKGGSASEASFAITALLEPPKIELKISDLTTRKSTVTVSGVAADNSSIKDFYVFVYSTVDKRFRAKKVAYRRGGDATMKLNAKIPLQKGMNRVRFFVRDADDMVSEESVFFFRE